MKVNSQIFNNNKVSKMKVCLIKKEILRSLERAEIEMLRAEREKFKEAA